MSASVHYQLADDNPVVEVFTTAEAAKAIARRVIKDLLKCSKPPLHIVEQEISSELIYKVSAIDESGRCERSYSVIKKGMMV